MRLKKCFVALLILLFPSLASAQFSGFPPVSSTQFKVAGVLQTPIPNYVDFSTGLSGSLSSGTLTITVTGGAPVPQTRLINTTSPLGGGGALSSDLTLTCTTCALITGWTIPSAFAVTTTTAAAETAGFATTWTTGAGGASAGAATGGIGGPTTWTGGVGGAGSGARAGGAGGSFAVTTGAGGAAAGAGAGGRPGSLSLGVGQGGAGSATGLPGKGHNASLFAGKSGTNGGAGPAVGAGILSLGGGDGSDGTAASTAGGGGGVNIASGNGGVNNGGGGGTSGSIDIDSGLATGAATNGAITIGVTNANSLTLGRSTKAVTADGNWTHSGTVTVANDAAAITSGSYQLNIKAGATSGILLTPIMTDGGSQTGVSIINSNGIDSAFTLLHLRTGYATGGVSFGIGTGTAGVTCREGQMFAVDTGGATTKKVQCLSGANKVQDCAKTTNLTTIAGIAMSTVASGGQVLVCTQGFVEALSTDAGCTAGLPAGTDGTGTAGHVQCAVAPPINSRVGRVSTAQSGSAVTLQIGY